MHYVTDLHLHSKYSRAVSPQMNLAVMATFAREKGLDILTAADFTHPTWFAEISAQLHETEEGLYSLQDHFDSAQDKKVLFMLSTEISSIYKEKDKLRRIHSLLFVPSLEIAEKVTKALVAQGCNLNADGRPIIGLSVRNLLELMLEIDERSLLIPAHVWTPHFGVYGSASGYEALSEAFEDLAPYVYGIETGISSDPGMNWAMPELQKRSILSFSDAHSPAKMGREATVMELEKLSYESIRQAIRYQSVIVSDPPAGGERGNLTNHEIASSPSVPRNDVNRIAYTIEFYPEEGKYHLSGHRNCKFAAGPQEIRASGNVCPVCNRKVTEGVLYRVQELTDPTLENRIQETTDAAGIKWYTDAHGKQPPYVKLVPLLEIVAESVGTSVNSQKAKMLYAALCRELGSELTLLLKTPLKDIEHVGGVQVASGIQKVRAGAIAIAPGFDGEYGKVSIWHDKAAKAADGPQMKLF